jgi:hypothetical protein
VIRLIFDKPQQIKRIWLRFVENEVERTQELHRPARMPLQAFTTLGFRNMLTPSSVRTQSTRQH